MAKPFRDQGKHDDQQGNMYQSLAKVRVAVQLAPTMGIKVELVDRLD